MAKNYWMLAVGPESYRATLADRVTTQVVAAQHRRKIERMEPGDKLVYYLVPLRRFTSTASVTSRTLEEPPPDATPPLPPPPSEASSGNGHSPDAVSEAGAAEPAEEKKLILKVSIRPEVVLDPQDYLDAYEIGPRLEYVKKWIPEKWHLAFHGFLHLIPKADFLLLESEMQKLAARPRRRA